MHLNTATRWECPNCPQTAVTPGVGGNRFHDCPGVGGLTAPMVVRGTRCKVVAKEREDYINGEDVTYNADGRPIMSIETTRNDGTDVVVFAPCANGDGRVT